jgi:hypothetical protein
VNTEMNLGLKLVVDMLSSFSNKTLLHGLSSGTITINSCVSRLCCDVFWIEVDQLRIE